MNSSETTEIHQPESLRELINEIPASCYEVDLKQVWPAIARAVIAYVLSSALLLTTDSTLFLIPLWLVAGFSVTSLFILGHDAAHGTLFKNRKLSKIAAQFFMLPSFHPVADWILGHNQTHHAHTSEQERDYVWRPLSPADFYNLGWFRRLLHRLEWSAFGAGIYYFNQIWVPTAFTLSFEKRCNIKRLIRDRIIVGFFIVGTLAICVLTATLSELSPAYGFWLWFKVIVVPWTIFTHIFGVGIYLHHTHPEVAWHRAETWNTVRGQLEGTINYSVPWFINLFIHNIFVHIPHHVDARIPFYRLPIAGEALKRRYPELFRQERLTLSGYLDIIRKCKLFDYDRAEWVSYRAAEARCLTER